jgi:hypothetical protein
MKCIISFRSFFSTLFILLSILMIVSCTKKSANTPHTQSVPISADNGEGAITQSLQTDFSGQGEVSLVANKDFVFNGTVLVQYQGKQKHVIIPPNLGITEIADGAFGFSEIISISIPEGVEKIGRSFEDCYSLTRVSLPSTLHSIGDYAFAYTGLPGISIPLGVTSIKYMTFYGCGGLTSMTIPSSVTSIGEAAFFYCSSLISITIPPSVTTIGDSAFYGCSSLASITIPPSVTTIGDYVFIGCNNLRTITLSRNTNLGINPFPGGVERVYSD